MTHRGGLLATGFEDGVIRLLELYDPQKLPLVSGRHPKGDAKLRLKQAFKPHNASVTAVAYDRSGKMFATGVIVFSGSLLFPMLGRLCLFNLIVNYITQVTNGF